ncbi:MAG: PatA/PatG family cyanobactin maturation protease [Nostoc sp.]|uniref:PatA/PatG family cyanobactin maturation protease n=1 Tax=Nostoc sp. TaxID=1180 RepID=UPI002FF947CA
MATLTTGLNDIALIPGLQSLWAETFGDPGICVAVLDGPVDQSHPCFDGANLARLPTLVADVAGSGLMSGHGTHITSVIFGQHSSPVHGVAPGCRGLIVPVFSDDRRRGKLSQLDLARAINQAVEAGSHVINISGGQLSQSGEADPMLVNAVRFCNEEGVLIVAAAGNDACECLHVPAALPSVLAVGAMNAQGLPFDFSNWGKTYQSQGILAPGENILGAEPGGGTAKRNGTSFATPIVSGIVALLLSIQLKRGEKPNPHAIRDAILKSALPCNSEIGEDCRRFLAGSLDIPGVSTLITKGGLAEVSEEKSEPVSIQLSQADDLEPKATDHINEIQQLEPSEAIDLSLEEVALQPSEIGIQAAEATSSESTSTTIQHSGNPMSVTSNNIATFSTSNSNVVPSGNCQCNGGAVTSFVAPSNAPKSLVYAIGTLGYDFGTEARRDSFKQLMPMIRSDNGQEVQESSLPAGVISVPAHPYDARQMAHYLENNISEAASLIWTLNLELTPIYAIEPQAPFAETIYKYFQGLLGGQVLAKEDDEYIERVSIPAILTGRTVTLFSGQVIPIIEPLNTRGMYGWKVNALIHAVMEAIKHQNPAPNLTPQQQEEIEYSLKNFLMRIYYDLRNLGQTSAERAQNFASTNIFQYADALVKVLMNQSRSWAVSGDPKAVTMQLDTFEVERSPFCRKDSDCWDIRIKFFDPENERRAKRVLRYTIDVSDIMPVTLGEPRLWDIAN